MAEKVGILSSGLRISFSSLTLKEMLVDESHLPLKRRKRWGAIVRPHISFSSLTLKEMFGVRIPPLERKRWGAIVRPSHFFFLAVRSGNARRRILFYYGRKGGYFIVRPRISDSSLTLKEMLSDESHRLSGKGGEQSSGLRISFSSLFAREMFGVRIPPLK